MLVVSKHFLCSFRDCAAHGISALMTSYIYSTFHSSEAQPHLQILIASCKSLIYGLYRHLFFVSVESAKTLGMYGEAR